MKKSERVVLVAGLTGSGKSSVIEAISKSLKMKKVFTSSILKQLLLKQSHLSAKNEKNQGFWETPEEKKLLKKRLSDKNFDLKLDKELLRIIDKGNVVMDSRTMPYLSKKGYKIWLTAPLNVRAKRLSLRDKKPLKQSIKDIGAKDNDDKKIYQKLYGFKLGENLEQFNLVLDTDNLNEKKVQRLVIQIVKNHFKSK